ncbi:flagellar hook-length control protein FliK [Nitrosomonas sp.]|uniref:flagellar hook-length control protein FliK n=1 Tax=Nitrosomonas sp. TaxID=42353 RepID=UPI00374D9C4B
MLNILVAPQIKSSAENPVAMINSGSTDTKESVAEEFGKVLEREVSEATGKHETNNTSDTKEHSDGAASSEDTVKDTDKDTDTTTSVATTTDDANSFIQNLLSNAGSVYKTDPALSAMNSVLNPDAMTEASTLPLALTLSTQNALVPLDSEQIVSSTIPISNQLLQQKLAQPNLAASSSNYLSDNIWQSLDAVDSAAYGKFLPFSSEINEAIQVNARESIFSTHGESISSQPFSLSSSASGIPLNTTLQDIHVDLPVGQPKWGGEFAQKVVWLSSQQHQVAEIRLNPAHLGPVEVMLSITQDQATAQFSSPHLAVREAIEQALPRLREMMAENGITLGNVMVGSDSFQQDNRQQQAYHSAKDTNNMAGARPETVGQIETTVTPNQHIGMVNTYA